MTPDSPAARTIVPSQSIRCRVGHLPRAEGGRDHRERDKAEREVDVEDPAPREVVDEEAAEQRTGDDRDAEHAAEQALVAAAVARRDKVTDDRHRHDEQTAAAEPLDRSERDQLRHALRQPAQRRADQEEHERELEDALAAVEVAELPVQRPDHRRREQIRGHDPREVLEAAEVADDRRQRRRHDRLVERRDEEDEEQRAEDQAPLTRRRFSHGAAHRRRASAVPRRAASRAGGSSRASRCSYRTVADRRSSSPRPRARRPQAAP